MLISIYKPRNKNVLQLWGKDDGRLFLNRTMSCPRFQKIPQAWPLMMQVQEEQEVMMSH